MATIRFEADEFNQALAFVFGHSDEELECAHVKHAVAFPAHVRDWAMCTTDPYNPDTDEIVVHVVPGPKLEQTIRDLVDRIHEVEA